MYFENIKIKIKNAKILKNIFCKYDEKYKKVKRKRNVIILIIIFLFFLWCDIYMIYCIFKEELIYGSKEMFKMWDIPLRN